MKKIQASANRQTLCWIFSNIKDQISKEILINQKDMDFRQSPDIQARFAAIKTITTARSILVTYQAMQNHQQYRNERCIIYLLLLQLAITILQYDPKRFDASDGFLGLEILSALVRIYLQVEMESRTKHPQIWRTKVTRWHTSSESPWTGKSISSLQRRDDFSPKGKIKQEKVVLRLHPSNTAKLSP